MQLLLEHHDLTIGVHHLVLLLRQLAHRLILFCFDIADELVQLGLGQIGQMRVEVSGEKVPYIIVKVRGRCSHLLPIE